MCRPRTNSRNLPSSINDKKQQRREETDELFNLSEYFKRFIVRPIWTIESVQEETNAGKFDNFSETLQGKSKQFRYDIVDRFVVANVVGIDKFKGRTSSARNHTGRLYTRALQSEIDEETNESKLCRYGEFETKIKNTKRRKLFKFNVAS